MRAGIVHKSCQAQRAVKKRLNDHLRNFMDAACIFGLIQLRNECIDQPLCLTIATEWIVANVNLLDFVPAPDQSLIDHRQIVIVQKQLKHAHTTQPTTKQAKNGR